MEDIPFHLVFQGHDKEEYYISEHINECIHFIEQNRLIFRHLGNSLMSWFIAMQVFLEAQL